MIHIIAIMKTSILPFHLLMVDGNENRKKIKTKVLSWGTATTLHLLHHQGLKVGKANFAGAGLVHDLDHFRDILRGRG
jgi:hypothetical protein